MISACKKYCNFTCVIKTHYYFQHGTVCNARPIWWNFWWIWLTLCDVNPWSLRGKKKVKTLINPSKLKPVACEEKSRKIILVIAFASARPSAIHAVLSLKIHFRNLFRFPRQLVFSGRALMELKRFPRSFVFFSFLFFRSISLMHSIQRRDHVSTQMKCPKRYSWRSSTRNRAIGRVCVQHYMHRTLWKAGRSRAFRAPIRREAVISVRHRASDLSDLLFASFC